MEATFRLGLIGAGKVTGDWHLPAAVASPDVEVAAIVDPVQSSAEQLAETAGIKPHVSTDVREVLGDIEGALIATPNHTHCELAVQCLEAGVSTLVEKPLATTTAEGEAIARAAERSRRVVAVGYCMRFLESVMLMRALLESKYFGRVRRFAYQSGTVGGSSSVSGFHLDREAVGGGVLVTTGTHFLDRMIHWFGYPGDCALEDDSRGGPEANALATFHYSAPDGGFEGTVRLSTTVALPPGFVMEMDRGTVLLRDGSDDPIRFRPTDHPGVECRLARTEGPLYPEHTGMFQRQLQDFVEACRQTREPMVPVDQGLEVIRIVEQLYARRKPLRSDWYDAIRRRA